MQPNQYNAQYSQWNAQQLGSNYQTNYYGQPNNLYTNQPIQQQYVQQPTVKKINLVNC